MIQQRELSRWYFYPRSDVKKNMSSTIHLNLHCSQTAHPNNATVPQQQHSHKTIRCAKNPRPTLPSPSKKQPKNNYEQVPTNPKMAFWICCHCRSTGSPLMIFCLFCGHQPCQKPPNPRIILPPCYCTFHNGPAVHPAELPPPQQFGWMPPPKVEHEGEMAWEGTN